MSGYLARLAARAGGAPAAGTPRVPSLFEQRVAAPAEDSAEIAGSVGPEHPSADVSRRAAGLGTILAGPAPIDRPSAERRVSRDRAGESPEGMPSPRAATTASSPRRDAAASAALARESPAPAVSPGPDVDHAVGLDRGGARVPAASVPASMPARPAVPRRVEASAPRRPAPLAAAPDADASAPAREPDVVHVTIGRVEVRASLAAAAAPPRPRAGAHDAAQSLHEYLAGRAR